MRVRSTTRRPGNHGFSSVFLVIPQFQQNQVSRRLWMRASSRLNLPSIDFLWVNCHPKEECFSVGRAIDCRGIYTKSIGRWFDSGCWDLHFFLRGGGVAPQPSLLDPNEVQRACWHSKWNLHGSTGPRPPSRRVGARREATTTRGSRYLFFYSESGLGRRRMRAGPGGAAGG